MSAALAATSDIVVVVDGDCVIGYVSPAAERVLGRPADHWRNRTIDGFVHPDDRETILELLADTFICLPRRSRVSVRVRAERADGRWAELEVTRLEPVSLSDEIDVMVVLRDVTAMAEIVCDLDVARAQYGFSVSHDAVTGLPNRAQLERHLDELADNDIGADRVTPLVMAKVVDVDELLSRYGARDAESIARTIGRTVRGLVPPGEFAAPGAGEFVVNSPGTSVSEIDELACRLLALPDMPMSDRGMRVDVRLVVGRSVLEPDRGAAVSLDELGQVTRCEGTEGSPSLSVVVGESSREDQYERRSLADDIERALAEDELELHYQPIRDVHSGRVTGFEGLLRWNHADDGVVTAAEFLPVVEGTALIVDIGDFVLEQGCAQLAQWQGGYGTAAPSLALNVSARQLREGDFASRVRREISRSGADPAGLCLELTETHALEGEPRALAQLERVRDLGASIALDDFGTGYSSLHQLQRIAADVLKIDRSFIKNVGIDAGATAIVRAAIDLGAAFGMTTVAEGVTTIGQQRLLLSMGCDRIQGYLIAPALPAELAEAMLRSERTCDPGLGITDPDRDVEVLQARGRLALIDDPYVPSEDEVATLAGVSSLEAQHGLIRPAQSAG